jgi:deazaflavin-dependent oxidoreductase (nitroreductase family)
MPMPRWLAEINKRFFNKLELKRGKRPVLTHVGRSSGKTYHTPLDAHRVDDSFMFILVYGSGSDWVQNALAAGTAQLEIDGEEFGLTSPRLVEKDEAWKLLAGLAKAPPGFMNVSEFLRMDISS